MLLVVTNASTAAANTNTNAIQDLLGFNVEIFAGSRGRTPLKPPPPLHDAAASSSTPPSLFPSSASRNRTVFIATIEKANGIVAHCLETRTLNRFGLVVVDELHMIGTGSRGAILEETLTKIVASPVGIVGMCRAVYVYRVVVYV